NCKQIFWQEFGRTTRSRRACLSRVMWKRPSAQPVRWEMTDYSGRRRAMLCPTLLLTEALSNAYVGFVAAWRPETFVRETRSTRALPNSSLIKFQLRQQR